MLDNVIIDTPKRLDDDIEDFKIDACEQEKNFTTSRLKLCRDPAAEKPVIFYSQELIRNFRTPNDPFNKRHIIKAFTPANFTAAIDTTLERKFGDTVLAHKPMIEDYSPLTDIHSQKMNLFMDEDTAVFLSDIGVNVDGVGEDFQSIESVSASPFMEDVAYDARKIKAELSELRRCFDTLKQQIAEEFSEYINPAMLPDEEFTERLANEKIPDALIQSYLSYTEKITRLECQLGEVNAAVFNETSARIKLPGVLKKQEVNGNV